MAREISRTEEASHRFVGRKRQVLVFAILFF
jgi:hypothetical protein